MPAKACWETIDQKSVFVLIVATLISRNGCGPKFFKIILAVLFYLDFLLSGQKGKSMYRSLKLTKNALKVWSHHHFSLLFFSIAMHNFSLATSHFKTNLCCLKYLFVILYTTGSQKSIYSYSVSICHEVIVLKLLQYLHKSSEKAEIIHFYFIYNIYIYIYTYIFYIYVSFHHLPFYNQCHPF